MAGAAVLRLPALRPRARVITGPVFAGDLKEGHRYEVLETDERGTVMAVREVWG